jgi:hypothetical protein
MRDLTDARWIKLKAVLFVLLGLLAATLLLAEDFSLRRLMLLGLVVWCFCRVYYFAFYVLERYVDPSYRFSGLFSAARHLWHHRTPRL